MGRRDNKGERPYYIVYIRGARRLSDSAKTLDGAMLRVTARLAKRHNRGEVAEVWCDGKMVHTTNTEGVLGRKASPVEPDQSQNRRRPPESCPVYESAKLFTQD